MAAAANIPAVAQLQLCTPHVYVHDPSPCDSVAPGRQPCGLAHVAGPCGLAHVTTSAMINPALCCDVLWCAASDMERRHLQEKEKMRKEAAAKIRETKTAMAQLAGVQQLEGGSSDADRLVRQAASPHGAASVASFPLAPARIGGETCVSGHVVSTKIWS